MGLFFPVWIPLAPPLVKKITLFSLNWSVVKKIDLFGNARVKQTQNESEGHHFVYNAITEEMSVDGNTKTIAISEDGKKLTIHSDYQQYNKTNEIRNSK